MTPPPGLTGASRLRSGRASTAATSHGYWTTSCRGSPGTAAAGRAGRAGWRWPPWAAALAPSTRPTSRSSGPTSSRWRCASPVTTTRRPGPPGASAAARCTSTTRLTTWATCTVTTSTGCAAGSACCLCAARASGRTPPDRCRALNASRNCSPARASGTSSTCGATTCRTTGPPGAHSSPITCHDSAEPSCSEWGPCVDRFQAPDRVAARYRGGLAEGVRGDTAPGGPGHGRRRYPARLRLRADHHRAVRPARPPPVQPGHRPARVLVLPPEGVAEEGLPDGRRVPAEQPVHVPVDGEARRLLRDDAAGPQGAGDGARPVQEPGGQRALRLHRRPLQPAVRPRRHRGADRLSAVHEAV